MGIPEGILDSMVNGEYFVLASRRSRKTCHVKLSRDHLNLIISGHGCFFKRQKKIKIADIKEIQPGHSANLWKKLKKKIPDKQLCFTIIMEKASKKNKNLIGVTGRIAEEWVKGILSLMHVIDNLSPEQQQYHWIWQHFKEADKDKNGTLSLSEIFKLFNNMSMPIAEQSKKRVKVIFKKFLTEEGQKKFDTSGDGKLSFTELIEFFKEVFNRPEITEIFNRHSKDKKHLTVDELVSFMQNVQGEKDMDTKVATNIIRKYEHLADDNNDVIMTPQGFANMLLSDDWGLPFSRIDSKEVHMDMTHPLSHYFIASSHNTYLSDHQLIGESNISNYQRAMDQGCRCVELDCWDGDDGEPVIYHGHTRTTKILFKHVIEVIRDGAFEKTDYPMLLSLENHCCVEQQDRMITIMKELFGDKLLLAPISETEDALPSPDALRNKIILKAKTLTPGKEGLISEELSDSIIYMKSRHFDGFDDARDTSSFAHMSSLGEEKAEGLADKETLKYIEHTQWQLVRIYPKGTRIKSSNYNPIPFWNVGSQIVALNYQSDDFETYTNLVSFRRNGGCGYLLKPSYLFSPEFNPLTSGEDCACAEPTTYQIQVISGQQLPKPKNNDDDDVIDPYVQIRIDGCNVDQQTQETTAVDNNGFNPTWFENLTFKVAFPKLAFMTFSVMDKDSIGSNEKIGRYTIPLDSLSPGYRHIFLETYKGEPLGPVSIFVHVDIKQG